MLSDRPHVPPNQRRTVPFSLKLSPDENAAIRAGARRAGQSLSDYIISRTESAAIRELAPTTPDAAPSDAPDERPEGETQ
jgi:hypothetical protein